MTFSGPIAVGPAVDIDDLAQRIATALRAAESPPSAYEQARTLYRQRRRRAEHFPQGLLAEPVWDMLLDLFITHGEGRDVTVSSACMAADVPMTTALRHLRWLTDAGLVQRVPHGRDARATIVRLTDEAHGAMTDYLNAIG